MASQITTYRIMKRLIDVFVVLIVLPIALPLIVIGAIAVSIEMPGSPLFVPFRTGQDGELIQIKR